MLLSGVELPAQASKYHHYKAPMISKTFYARDVRKGKDRLAMNKRADNWAAHVSNIRDYKITTETSISEANSNIDMVSQETVILTRKYESKHTKITNFWLRKIAHYCRDLG